MPKTHLTLTNSPTLAINALAAQKTARGEKVYNLSAGEPMLAPHPLIMEAANRAVTEGKTLYTPVPGILELRAAATNWMNATYKTNYSAQNSLVTCGGKFAIFAALQAYVQPGDEVLVISPYWVSYPAMVHMFGGTPIFVETKEENNWQLEVATVEKALSQKTKIIIINSGANPTGAVYNKKTLEALAKLCVEKNILLISDEVYSELTYEGEYISLGSFLQNQNTIVIQSCSKHFAMTGWRVGFAFAQEEIINTLSKIQSQSTTGTSTISQWAALAAIQNAGVILPWVKTNMQKRRDIFIKTFNTLFKTNIKPPTSGLYCFFSLTLIGVSETDDVAWCEKVLREANVALVPGTAFGAPGFVRASFGADESELVAGLEKLKEYLTTKKTQ